MSFAAVSDDVVPCDPEALTAEWSPRIIEIRAGERPEDVGECLYPWWRLNDRRARPHLVTGINTA